MKFALPDGFEDRVQWSRFGSLHVGTAGRLDLIALKLFAAVDNPGFRNVHYQDLLAMRPTQEELATARAWVVTQDASSTFPALVDAMVRRLTTDLELA